MDLQDWEVALIKSMLQKGDWTQQQIHAHFTRPQRDFNQRLISQIARNQVFQHVRPAGADVLADFLETWQLFPEQELAAVGGFNSAFQVGYHFLPVGQGLFAAGRLRRAGFAPFVWVYDCGTETQGVDIAALIDGCPAFPVAVGDRKPRLDLVAISHFDSDHISGMVTLLSRFEVGELLLPYLSPWDRLLLLLASGAAATSPLARFLRDPVGILREAASIERILLVQPGGRAVLARRWSGGIGAGRPDKVGYFGPDRSVCRRHGRPCRG